MDAPPDHDPMPVILGQLALMAERRREQGDYREPTEEQKADVRRQLEEMIERHRAERQAVRDFSDAYEASRRSRQ
jgi:hypothetical protein